MNMTDHDQLIERYLNGAMGATEELEFRRRLDTDRELQRLLEAERVVKSALARDSAALAVPGAAAYGRFMTMLEGTAPVPASATVASKPGNRRVIVILLLLLLITGSVLLLLRPDPSGREMPVTVAATKSTVALTNLLPLPSATPIPSAGEVVLQNSPTTTSPITSDPTDKPAGKSAVRAARHRPASVRTASVREQEKAAPSTPQRPPEPVSPPVYDAPAKTSVSVGGSGK